jgi:hypothetical protein
VRSIALRHGQICVTQVPVWQTQCAQSFWPLLHVVQICGSAPWQSEAVVH